MKNKMKPTTTQYDIWESEHKNPFMFPCVDSQDPSPGVVEFWDWLIALQLDNANKFHGLEICCGKGRNAIWLSNHNVEMCAFDFSRIAIEEANRRQELLNLKNNVDFAVQDATTEWPYSDQTFDFVIDCFGSSDIESQTAREHILNEALRVLKPGGYYFLQIDSPELGFFAERFQNNPGTEKNTLLFPNGKVESVLREEDLEMWSHPLSLVSIRRIIEENVEIFGQVKPYKYFWIVAQSPLNE